MTPEQLRRKVAPIIIRRTLTQAARMARPHGPSRDVQSGPVTVTPPPLQQELPLNDGNDNIVLGYD